MREVLLVKRHNIATLQTGRTASPLRLPSALLFRHAERTRQKNDPVDSLRRRDGEEGREGRDGRVGKGGGVERARYFVWFDNSKISLTKKESSLCTKSDTPSGGDQASIENARKRVRDGPKKRASKKKRQWRRLRQDWTTQKPRRRSSDLGHVPGGVQLQKSIGIPVEIAVLGSAPAQFWGWCP